MKSVGNNHPHSPCPPRDLRSIRLLFDDLFDVETDADLQAYLDGGADMPALRCTLQDLFCQHIKREPTLCLLRLWLTARLDDGLYMANPAPFTRKD